jgi:hypothetical protein
MPSLKIIGNVDTIRNLWKYGDRYILTEYDKETGITSAFESDRLGRKGATPVLGKVLGMSHGACIDKVCETLEEGHG